MKKKHKERILEEVEHFLDKGFTSIDIIVLKNGFIIIPTKVNSPKP